MYLATGEWAEPDDVVAAALPEKIHAALQAVLALHATEHTGYRGLEDICGECSGLAGAEVSYPCGTVQTLVDALTEEKNHV